MQELFEVYNEILEYELLLEISSIGNLVSFEEGDILIKNGTYVKTMPLLVDGVIKIMRPDFDSGELLLYFIERGESCVITFSCCIDNKITINAIAETRGKMIMIPIDMMEIWMGRYKSWRNFIFKSYSNRFNELLTKLDSIAFSNLSERLHNYLMVVSKINNTKIINKTHQEIADELNTSRVVVSRLLKSIEKKGIISLSRSNIRLLD